MVGVSTGPAGMRPRRLRRGRRLGAVPLAIIALGATVASCGDDGPDVSGASVDHRVAVVEEALAPPGTELADEVEVQPGSSLVGAVFPDVGYPPDSQELAQVGWQATLVVDGDPIDVWNTYAEALGVHGADAVDACVVSALAPVAVGANESGEPPPRRFLTEDRLEGENRLTCSYMSATVEMAMSVGVACSYDDTQCTLVPISHMRIAIAEYSSPDMDMEVLGTDQLRYERAVELDCKSGDDCPAPHPSDGPPMVDIPDGPAVAPAVEVSGESVLPLPGERFDAELDFFLDYRDDSAIRVPEGGRSLVAPALLIDCNSGLVAVLEVPGSPMTAVETFLADVDASELGSGVSGTTNEGRVWAYGTVREAGGAHIDYIALENDGNSLVTITECGD